MIFFKTWSLPCRFPSTYYNWQRLEHRIFQNELANVNFSTSIRRQFAILQFTDSFVCSFSVLDLMDFFSIIIMFQWFKNHFTLKLSLVKVGSFFSLSFRVRWLVISRFSQTLLLWKEVVVFCLQTIFFSCWIRKRETICSCLSFWMMSDPFFFRISWIQWCHVQS